MKLTSPPVVTMDDKELLKELEVEFEKMRKDLGFSATFDELDTVFFLKEYILATGYLSDRLSRMIARRITDGLGNWNGYFHGLVMPTPTSMINVTESNMFNDDERKAMIPPMNAIMELISRNTLIGLTNDKVKEGKWFDDCLEFWNKTLKQEVTKVMKRTNSTWAEKVRSNKKEN